MRRNRFEKGTVRILEKGKRTGVFLNFWLMSELKVLLGGMIPFELKYFSAFSAFELGVKHIAPIRRYRFSLETLSLIEERVT
jgi:hypothetical protein